MALSNFTVIKRMVLSDKARMLFQKQNKVCLLVDPSANKPIIKKAVESMWDGVKVSKVAVVNLPGATKTFKGKKFSSSGCKKAIVTIESGSGLFAAD
jgi:large subunit ribosomal protein L23